MEILHYDNRNCLYHNDSYITILVQTLAQIYPRMLHKPSVVLTHDTMVAEKLANLNTMCLLKSSYH